MQKVLSYLALVLLFILGIIAGYWLRGLRQPKPEPIVQIDTLILRDTLTVEKPVPHYVRVVDTMLIPVTDTLLIRDSVFISIPREEKVYEDSTYRAVVSGYRPSLDSISVYQTTKVITVTKEKEIRKHWGLGVQAGATYLPDKGVTPYIGLGLSYNILTF